MSSFVGLDKATLIGFFSLDIDGQYCKNRKVKSLSYHLFSRFMIVVICQIVIGLGLSWNYVDGDLLQRKINLAFENLEGIAYNVNYFYQHQMEELERISERSFKNKKNVKPFANALKIYIETRKIITSIHYYKANGNLSFIVKTDNTPEYDPEWNYKKHASPNFVNFFEKARDEKTVVFTNPLYTQSNKFYHLALIPIFNNNKQDLHGILSVAFFPHLNPMSDSLTGLPLLDQNFLVITDTNANMVAASGVDKELIKPTLTQFLKERRGGHSNPFHHVWRKIQDLVFEVDGTKYYMIARKVPNLPFLVVHGLKKNIIHKDLAHIIKMMIIVFAFSTLIGLFFSIHYAKKISNEIFSLTSAINNLRAGKFAFTQKKKLHKDFEEAIDQVQDLSLEIEKGRLFGNLWGQESALKDKEL